jgi:hypothetical protein
MDVSAAGLSNMAQSATASEISMRVAKKALDASKAQGEAAISLLQAAADMQKQERTNATGPGGSLDVMA